MIHQTLPMENPTRLAFDLGGVIIQRKGQQNLLIQESLISVKLTIQKLGPQNVFILSKAKPKYQQKNIDFLNTHNFFTQTGFLIQNLHFVHDRIQKGPLGKKLGLNYILDDRISAVHVARQAGFQCILFGQSQEVQMAIQNVMRAKGWKEFREFLEKLK